MPTWLNTSSGKGWRVAMDDIQRVGGSMGYARTRGAPCPQCGHLTEWLIPPTDRPYLPAIEMCICGYAAYLERKEKQDEEVREG